MGLSTPYVLFPVPLNTVCVSFNLYPAKIQDIMKSKTRGTNFCGPVAFLTS